MTCGQVCRLDTTLDLPGGGAQLTVPYLKRAGFLTLDGAPAELYKQFRNPSLRGGAAARELRSAYSGLYAANDYVHDASDKDSKRLIVQVTGLGEDTKLIPAMIGIFRTLKEYADFNAEDEPRVRPTEQ